MCKKDKKNGTFNIYVGYNYPGSGYRTVAHANSKNSSVFYDALKASIPSPYDWRSVSQINGKNGTLTCSFIKKVAIGDATDGFINREDLLVEGTKCSDLFAGMINGTLYNFMETVDGYRLVVKRFETYYAIGFKVGDDVE